VSATDTVLVLVRGGKTTDIRGEVLKLFLADS